MDGAIDTQQEVGSNAGSVTGVAHQPANAGNVVNVTVPGHTQHDAADNEPEHVQTIRLINDWMGKLTRRMDEQAQTHERDYRELKSELASLRQVVEGMNAAVMSAVHVPPNHMALFSLAMALLFVPVVTYYHDAKLVLGVHWQFAYGAAALCYLVSGLLWWYLFFGGKG